MVCALLRTDSARYRLGAAGLVRKGVGNVSYVKLSELSGIAASILLRNTLSSRFRKQQHLPGIAPPTTFANRVLLSLQCFQDRFAIDFHPLLERLIRRFGKRFTRSISDLLKAQIRPSVYRYC